ncbi:MAG: hypothetical protein V3T84_16310 [Phycisphaerales bacterium]
MACADSIFTWSLCVAEERIIRIMCPNLVCLSVLSVPERARGKLVRCGGCGVNIRIPQSKTDNPTADASETATPPPSG